METKHTPGPWRSAGRYVYTGGTSIQDRTKTICRMIKQGGNVEANARLIAASPTLFEYADKKAKEGCQEARKMLALLGITDKD